MDRWNLSSIGCAAPSICAIAIIAVCTTKNVPENRRCVALEMLTCGNALDILRCNQLMFVGHRRLDTFRLLVHRISSWIGIVVKILACLAIEIWSRFKQRCSCLPNIFGIGRGTLSDIWNHQILRNISHQPSLNRQSDSVRIVSLQCFRCK